MLVPCYKEGGSTQNVKGGIYLTEDGLIMGPLIAEISYLSEMSKYDLYRDNYNADFKLRYYSTMFVYFELLVWTAWSVVLASLILIASQAKIPDEVAKITPRDLLLIIKTLVSISLIVPPILFVISVITGLLNPVEKKVISNPIKKKVFSFLNRMRYGIAWRREVTRHKIIG